MRIDKVVGIIIECYGDIRQQVEIETTGRLWEEGKAEFWVVRSCDWRINSVHEKPFCNWNKIDFDNAQKYTFKLYMNESKGCFNKRRKF